LGPLLKIFKRKDSIQERLRKIKAGDVEERERLIGEYIPFIIKTITNKTNKYIEIENHEEYSIGLEAFNEAIDRYVEGKGNFIKYAEKVINSRIIDYLRRERENSKLSYIDAEVLGTFKEAGERDFTRDMELKEQVAVLKVKLESFDITFDDLVKESPKHRDTRLKAINLSWEVSKDKEIMDLIKSKKTLPMKRITERYGVTKKFLKGNRKFIIAMLLIIDSDLDLLQDYIKGDEGRAFLDS